MHNPTTFVIFAPMTNNHKIVDYDAVLDAKFGKEGTPERARAEEAAYSIYVPSMGMFDSQYGNGFRD